MGEGTDRHYFIEELNQMVNEISIKIVKELSSVEKDTLLANPNYAGHHFGFGLYIRNNFIYQNNNIKYKVKADSLSSKIFEEVIRILKKGQDKEV